MHPAQVKRSEVQTNTCATSKPVGPPLLIDTSEEGDESMMREKRAGRVRGGRGGDDVR